MTAKRFRLFSLSIVLLLHTQAIAQESEMPSDDFLEYLATLVDQDGEWVDPLELEELPDDELDIDVGRELTDKDAQHAEETP